MGLPLYLTHEYDPCGVKEIHEQITNHSKLSQSHSVPQTTQCQKYRPRKHGRERFFQYKSSQNDNKDGSQKYNRFSISNGDEFKSSIPSKYEDPIKCTMNPYLEFGSWNMIRYPSIDWLALAGKRDIEYGVSSMDVTFISVPEWVNIEIVSDCWEN